MCNKEKLGSSLNQALGKRCANISLAKFIPLPPGE